MASLSVQPGTIIEADGLWRVVLNRNQNLLGRCMLVLARDETDVAHIRPEEWVELHRQIVRVKAALDKLFTPDHYNYAFLMNQDPQVHLHVMPRYRTHREWNGERFNDPHFGSMVRPTARVLDKVELELLTSLIAAAVPPAS